MTRIAPLCPKMSAGTRVIQASDGHSMPTIAMHRSRRRKNDPPICHGPAKQVDRSDQRRSKGREVGRPVRGWIGSRFRCGSHVGMWVTVCCGCTSGVVSICDLLMYFVLIECFGSRKLHYNQTLHVLTCHLCKAIVGFVQMFGLLVAG